MYFIYTFNQTHNVLSEHFKTFSEYLEGPEVSPLVVFWSGTLSVWIVWIVWISRSVSLSDAVYLQGWNISIMCLVSYISWLSLSVCMFFPGSFPQYKHMKKRSTGSSILPIGVNRLSPEV